ncbi:hypothetical protein I2492_12310 [Budviciaceae bacterium CWB-B4]|uniref:Uncharacterized protein n=1 Tax=Limnobaculum xujianqingii TaxID=2738837 RepID=A0A9D7AJ36_9GAMM|nr:hypothetical protein [Limnobaculum xujianqingii]MBK5074005.1 hypothetical protein [Limnobaculum xujianqingii]MBK5177101.1 hypothetical protein [Limnobaculum xujianqingii]
MEIKSDIHKNRVITVGWVKFRELNHDLSGTNSLSFLDSPSMRGYNAASNFPDFIRDASDNKG